VPEIGCKNSSLFNQAKTALHSNRHETGSATTVKDEGLRGMGGVRGYTWIVAR